MCDGVGFQNNSKRINQDKSERFNSKNHIDPTFLARFEAGGVAGNIAL